MGIADWRLAIGDWRLAIGDCSSEAGRHGSGRRVFRPDHVPLPAAPQRMRIEDEDEKEDEDDFLVTAPPG
jgi:hypothetical protein